MNDVDYARIHWSVAVKVWLDSPRWAVLFSDFPEFCAAKVETEALALDLAVAASISGPRPRWLVPSWCVVAEEVAA